MLFQMNTMGQPKFLLGKIKLYATDNLMYNKAILPWGSGVLLYENKLLCGKI